MLAGEETVGTIAESRCTTVGHVPSRVLVFANRAQNRSSFEREGMKVVMRHVTEIDLFQSPVRLFATQIVAELECFSSHDSVKKSGELKLGANWTTAGASLDLGTLAGKRLLRILFAFEALEVLRRGSGDGD